MDRESAKSIVDELDALEAWARHVECGMNRIRRRLQDEFMLKMWDYDPTAKTLASPAPRRTHRK